MNLYFPTNKGQTCDEHLLKFSKGFEDENKRSRVLNICLQKTLFAKMLHLIFKYYLFKSCDTRKISLERLKKNIIKIYNIEIQICYKKSKKKHILEKSCIC